MALSRRSLLIAGGGAAALLAAGGGAAAYIFTRSSDGAIEPWAAAGDAAFAADPRLDALSYAILAPNPHNMQPWRIVLEPDGETLTLACNLDKRLPETDPFDRQITIGFGCFTELLRLAAAQEGYRAEIAPFPEGQPMPQLDERPIARIKVSKDESVQPERIFEVAKQRRSNKEPYDTSRSVDARDLRLMRNVAHNSDWVEGTSQEAPVERIREITWAAFQTEVKTPATWKESVDVMRIGAEAVDKQPDGIDLTGPMIEGLKLVGMMSKEEMLDPTSTAFQEGLALYEPVLMSGMGYIWQATPDNSRKTQLATGADWLRINLKATEVGLSIQPVSQALQEYPEMAEHRKALYDFLRVPEGLTLQMLGRLGYGPEIPPAPRWPLDAKLAKA